MFEQTLQLFNRSASTNFHTVVCQSMAIRTKWDAINYWICSSLAIARCQRVEMMNIDHPEKFSSKPFCRIKIANFAHRLVVVETVIADANVATTNGSGSRHKLAFDEQFPFEHGVCRLL